MAVQRVPVNLDLQVTGRTKGSAGRQPLPHMLNHGLRIPLIR